MASNIVTAGLGHRLVSGGLAGNGLATGSVTLIQNPSFETAGADPGTASNWDVTIVSSAVEFCAFTRPGLSVVTDTIPAEFNDLGITIVENPDGTITLLQAAGLQAAQEDFEAAWLNNDQYLFTFPSTALGECFFGVSENEDFEVGWLNDPGMLDVFDEIASAIVAFSHRINPSTLAVITDEFENFEGRWPDTAPGYFISAIPDIVFGTATYQGGYESNPLGIIVDATPGGTLQYADSLLMTVTDITPVPLSVTVTMLDQNDSIRTVVLTVPAHTPVGTILNGGPALYGGIRAIESVVAATVMPGVVFSGGPGFLLDENEQRAATWERATFILGQETFELGWVDGYSDSFEHTTLGEAGFAWVVLGDIEISSGVFTASGSVFDLPEYGHSLTATAIALTGYSSLPNTLTIGYKNQIGATSTTTFGPVVAGTPFGTSFAVDLALSDLGVQVIDSVSRSAVQTGQIQFEASRYIAETFINIEWPAPDVGL